MDETESRQTGCSHPSVTGRPYGPDRTAYRCDVCGALVEIHEIVYPGRTVDYFEYYYMLQERHAH